MALDKVTVVAANSKLQVGFVKTWYIMLKNVLASRELIWQLFRRDFLMQYKKSFLGMGWLLIAPIIGIASWVFMNQTGVLAPGDVGIPYPAYVLLSSSIWGLFMGFYSSSMGTLSAGSGFIMQVKFPHEALYVKQILQHLSNFLITFILNIFVLLAFGVTLDWKVIFFPVLILPLLFLGSAIGLVLSVMSVVATDISRGVNTIMGFLIYITPVIYSSEPDNEVLAEVISYNPLTYLIGAVRDIMIYGEYSDMNLYWYFSAGTFVIFLFALRLFYVSEDQVIEKMI